MPNNTMTQTRRDTPPPPAQAELLERLRAHRTLSQMPSAELEWLVGHGTIEHYAVGERLARRGEPVPGMYVILQGRVSHFTHQAGAWRKVLEWGEGDITGFLPYSRMGVARGNTIIDEAVETLMVPREDVPAMPVACPELTGALVHAMLDRAREFKSSDFQVEKLASLGKLAAGMAHELNNPASAALRSAQLLTEALAESDGAARTLGAAGLSPSEQALLDRMRSLCLAAPASVPSPLERADREDAIADWLMEHDADESFAAALGDAGVQIETLEQLAGALAGEKLSAGLRWVAAACTVGGLARDLEHAASRVHELVSAVKRFTYMDHGAAPEPVDVGKGLTDTMAVLTAKARGKGAALRVDVAIDLPRVNGVGGELNQVWANLVDNALDAVGEGGQVTVTAEHQGESVLVRVVDDGPGIPAEVKSRMFDAFFTTKPVGAGTGLGLDIAQRLVDRHEGSIDVTSEPGRTEFRVTLPVAGTPVG
jgi:signal transduction histidine kinase